MRRALVIAMMLMAACSREEAGEGIPNVKLGMAPRDVRSRFQPDNPGSWQTALGAGDDTALEWRTGDPKSSLQSARFEFHLGMLVAVRAQTSERSTSERIAHTAKTVTVRAPKENGTAITMLARDCPTHKEEAEGFVSRSK